MYAAYVIPSNLHTQSALKRGQLQMQTPGKSLLHCFRKHKKTFCNSAMEYTVHPHISKPRLSESSNLTTHKVCLCYSFLKTTSHNAFQMDLT